MVNKLFLSGSLLYYVLAAQKIFCMCYVKSVLEFLQTRPVITESVGSFVLFLKYFVALVVG